MGSVVMNANVYWIHRKDHTNVFTQGYIGITNNIKRRWYKHKTLTQNMHLKNAINKYGWDNLVKEVILIADNDYCLSVEKILRPSKDIGWNIVEGGGMPPKNNKGKGYKLPNAVLNSGNFKKGSIPHNKGIPCSQETKDKISVNRKGGTSWCKGLKGVMVAWNKGIKTPDDVKLKQSIAKLGRKLSMETRMKMSQAQIKRHQNKLGERHGK